MSTTQGRNQVRGNDAIKRLKALTGRETPPALALDLIFRTVEANPREAEKLFRGRWVNADNPMQWRHDIEVLQYFIGTQGNPNTQRRYQLELERALLWFWIMREKTLSDCEYTDIVGYMDWLAGRYHIKRNKDPHYEYWRHQEASRSQKKKTRARVRYKKDGSLNALWRPYNEKTPSAKTRKHIKTILGRFFSWARNKDYLAVNVMADMPSDDKSPHRYRLAGASPARGFLANRHQSDSRPKAEVLPINADAKLPDAAEKPKLDIELHLDLVPRFISLRVWEGMINQFESTVRSTSTEERHFQQARFQLQFLYCTGARLHELATHSFAHLRFNENRLVWYVVGKGGFEAKVPVHDSFREALDQYLSFLGKPFKEVQEIMLPLALNVTGRKKISQRQIFNIIQRTLRENLPQPPGEWPTNPHCIRHSIITHMLNDWGYSPQDTFLFARHKDITTTMSYYQREKIKQD